MAAEKKGKGVASLVNLCHLFMKEVGMPSMALQELLSRASATIELESLESVMFWKSVTANFYDMEEKISMGPFKFKPHKNKQVILKPRIPDLNQPAPQNEEPRQSVNMQDDAEFVEVEAKATTTGGKRKTAQASHRVVKRLKVAAESAGPANNGKGKDNLVEMEGWGEN